MKEIEINMEAPCAYNFYSNKNEYRQMFFENVRGGLSDAMINSGVYEYDIRFDNRQFSARFSIKLVLIKPSKQKRCIEIIDQIKKKFPYGKEAGMLKELKEILTPKN